MRAFFVLVLVLGCFCCMVALPVPWKLEMAFAGAVLGVVVERRLFQRRDPEATQRVYFAFVALLGLMILLLPWAARSVRLGSVFLLVAFSGFGAELSIARRASAARKLVCKACGKKVGRWPASDLLSFVSWKCPSCDHVTELHESPRPNAPKSGEPYRTATAVEHRDRIFKPDLPPMGIALPKWLAVVMLMLMAYPILGVLFRGQ